LGEGVLSDITMIIFLVQLPAVTSGYTFCLPEKLSPRSCWNPL